MMSPELAQLAEAFGVETSYADMTHRMHNSPIESVMAVLRMLGAPLDRADQAAEALRDRQRRLWQTVAEPIALVWDGDGGEAVLRQPANGSSPTVRCTLDMEDGRKVAWDDTLNDDKVRRSAEASGVAYREYRVALPANLPLGYHRLRMEMGGREHETVVISAPTRSYRPAQGSPRKWGVFAPLYAVRSARDCGIGDFTDLGDMLAWVRSLGGSMVGALPLMASFIHQRENVFDPSPYAPASRLFWNEVFLDIDRIAASAQCPEAVAILNSEDFRAKRAELRRLSLVDYLGVMELKRSVLMALAGSFFANPSRQDPSFRSFLEQNPRVEEYARFRATCERQGTSWWTWPERQRQGTLRDGDYDEAVFRYHLFAQWQCFEQLSGLKNRNGQKGLYLDLPLGSSCDSYDVWSERDLFVSGASVGAPEDDFAVRGQNWGFFPVHPQRQREQGYRFFRQVLGNMMQFAQMIRIDHLPGLHRLFFIPQGATPADGVFVQYPHEELYAIFCLESNRHRVEVMGEDAGVMPTSVHPAMERHEINHLYMAQCHYRSQKGGLAPEVPANSVASLSTHDLATFAAFWRGLDLDDRLTLGQMNGATYRKHRRSREFTRIMVQSLLTSSKTRGFWKRLWHRGVSELSWRLPDAWLRKRWTKVEEFVLLKKLLMAMAESPARAVIVNLEDLWLSAEAQNVPGTWKERPNWRRRTAFAFEEFTRMSQVCDTLEEVDSLRKQSIALRSAAADRRASKAA